MSKDNIDTKPCLPIATISVPSSKMELMGFVAASGGWNISGFAYMTNDLAVLLSKKALEQFPTATALYNFRWFKGSGYHGHEWFDGTADVYQESK